MQSSRGREAKAQHRSGSARPAGLRTASPATLTGCRRRAQQLVSIAVRLRDSSTRISHIYQWREAPLWRKQALEAATADCGRLPHATPSAAEPPLVCCAAPCPPASPPQAASRPPSAHCMPARRWAVSPPCPGLAALSAPPPPPRRQRPACWPSPAAEPRTTRHSLQQTRSEIYEMIQLIQGSGPRWRGGAELAPRCRQSHRHARK